jgi:hypothetical protein
MSETEDEETSPEVMRDLAEGGAFLGGYVARPESARPATPAPRAERPSGRWEERLRGPRPVPPGAEPPAPPRPATPGVAYDPAARARADALYGRNRGPDVPSPPRRVTVRGEPDRPRPAQPPAAPARDPHALELPREPGEKAGGYWFLETERGPQRPRTADASARDAERRAADRARAEERRHQEFLETFRRENPSASEYDAEVAWSAALRSSTLDTGD